MWTFQTGEAKWKHLLDTILFKQKFNLELWRKLASTLTPHPPEETELEYSLQFDTHLLKCYNQAV